MIATITLYAVRNRDGKWFRSKGRGGYGDTWVADANKAKLYTKIGQARGRVTYFATTWPEYGTPDIVEFAATESLVLNEAARVEKASDKKAQAKAAREVAQHAAAMRRAEHDKREAETRLAKLRAKR
jgi:hypothetical protein